MKTEEMKDRIAHIIRAKNLTAADFAMRLGIQPSNISHLLSGRNNPSLDFVKKLKETFPEYNLDWIVFGTGAMSLLNLFHKLKCRRMLLLRVRFSLLWIPMNLRKYRLHWRIVQS